MRKPRDFDSELKALDARARSLKTRRITQLGELVTATSADALPMEELAGALLAIAATAEPQKREAWRRRGAEFFSGQRGARKSGGTAGSQHGSAAAPASGAQPPRPDQSQA